MTGKVILGWLRMRRYTILLFVMFCAFFLIIYALYGYAWGTGLYACALGLATGIVFAVVDIARFAARHRELTKLVGRFPTASLPEASNLLEEDYGAIIEALEEERARLLREKENDRRDAGEYYTLWVHQIKTPISVLRLLLQSGQEGAPPNTPAMENALFRTEQYVEMALQYQRLSTMQDDLVLKSHTLDALVKKAAKGCAPLFIYSGIPLHIGAVEGAVITDEKWFAFVLEQLLSNAQKYTRAGEVSVYTEGDTLVVADTGIGILPEDLPRVFERGYTGAVGRNERSSTGLGLHLCREVMERLGFSISIQSTPGKGTRVLLHLAQRALKAE